MANDAEPINLSISLNPDVAIPDEVVPMLIDRLAHLEPELQAAARVVKEYNQENFATEGGIFSGGWPALADSTEIWKHRHGYSPRPLVRSGLLQNAIDNPLIEYSDDSVSVGIDSTLVPYAKYHQEGTSRMPQRILISVTDQEMQDVRAAVQETLNAIPGIPSGAIIVSVI